MTFTASDDDSNASECASSVSVVDTIGPEIDEGLGVSPGMLLPANHELMAVTVSNLIAQDACQADVQLYCSVESNEAVNGPGDGNTPFDIVFNGEPIFSPSTGLRPVPMTGNAGNLPLQLRAERSGNGSGRVYTITCHAVDGGGFAAPSRSVEVLVPALTMITEAGQLMARKLDEHSRFQELRSAHRPAGGSSRGIGCLRNP